METPVSTRSILAGISDRFTGMVISWQIKFVWCTNSLQDDGESITLVDALLTGDGLLDAQSLTWVEVISTQRIIAPRERRELIINPYYYSGNTTSLVMFCISSLELAPIPLRTRGQFPHCEIKQQDNRVGMWVILLFLGNLLACDF